MRHTVMITYSNPAVTSHLDMESTEDVTALIDTLANGKTYMGTTPERTLAVFPGNVCSIEITPPLPNLDNPHTD